jgi:hypothetical protein
MSISPNTIGYSTHLRLLIKYLLLCPKNANIAETGCGLFSSIIMSEFAAANNAFHFIYYSDEIWKNRIKKLVNPEFTKFIYVDKWITWQPKHEAFLYFHDSEEKTIHRYRHIDKILQKCNYLIVHDIDSYLKAGCDINTFDKIDEDIIRRPWTAVFKGLLYNDKI